jgi:hypothetical protein
MHILTYESILVKFFIGLLLGFWRGYVILLLDGAKKSHTVH